MDPLLNRTLGQYQILSEIGRAGMAVVYKAWQPALKRYWLTGACREVLATGDVTAVLNRYLPQGA